MFHCPIVSSSLLYVVYDLYNYKYYTTYANIAIGVYTDNVTFSKHVG